MNQSSGTTGATPNPKRISAMTSRLLRYKNTLLFGGAALWGLTLVSCVMVNRTIIMPPQVAGAQFVGSKNCVECHGAITASSAPAPSSHARGNGEK